MEVKPRHFDQAMEIKTGQKKLKELKPEDQPIVQSLLGNDRIMYEIAKRNQKKNSSFRMLSERPRPHIRQARSS